MAVDWNGVISELTGNHGWRESAPARPGYDGFGEDVWFEAVDGQKAYLHTDLGHASLQIVVGRGNPNKVIWSGDIDELYCHSTLSQYVSFEDVLSF